jgi:GNAT superfamily N-acetyltransferase
MEIGLRPAQEHDFNFAYEAKKLALGPHVEAHWSWNDEFQLGLHQQRWSERPWFVMELEGVPIGTVSIERHEDHIRFGEFYLLPSHQRCGIGSAVLHRILAQADEHHLPVALEYLKWNPVGSLYRRHGFVVVGESEIHYFMRRVPMEANPSNEQICGGKPGNIALVGY